MKWSTIILLISCLFLFFAVESYCFAPPANLTALTGNEIVFLEWQEPIVYDWIHWDNGQLGHYANMTAESVDVAIRFSPACMDSLGVSGKQLTKVRFHTGTREEAAYTIKVWIGGDGTSPETLVYQQQVNDFYTAEWNTVELDSLLSIDTERDLWIGYSMHSVQGVMLACDSGPAKQGFGDLINLGGEWTTLYQLSQLLNYNHNIQGFVAYPEDNRRSPQFDSEEILLSNSSLSTYADHSSEELPNPAYLRANMRNLSDVTSYIVYRDSEKVAMLSSEQLHYIDSEVVNHLPYIYHITAIYGQEESTESNSVEVTPHEHISHNAPVSLNGSLIGEQEIHLDWQPPAFGEWMHWDSGITGNSIGTGEAAHFKVAIRFSPKDLIGKGVGGGYLRKVKFVPRVADCVYTINVWTGGTSLNPGNLIYEKLVTQPQINSWNTVSIDTLIYVDHTEELWIGYNVNTQAGHPAACDNGPPVDGFGNLIYFNQQWSTLPELNPELTGNWNIQGHIDFLDIEPDMQHRYPPALKNDGYRVYRNEQMIAEINRADSLSFIDSDLPFNAYHYYLTATYGDEESEPTTILRINTEPSFIIYDSFDRYDDFAVRFAPWSVVDFDRSPTYELPGFDYPNKGEPMAFMVFNPRETEPPFDLFEPYRGSKMLVSFAATEGENNDWLMTSRLELGQNSLLSFRARSLSTEGNPERMRVGLATTGINPVNYEPLHEEEFYVVPAQWTEYSFDISEWDGQGVWLAINNVSVEGKALFIDDFRVRSVKDTSTEQSPSLITNTLTNYPNPFNPETTISFSLSNPGNVVIDIYNVKGQRIAVLADDFFEAGSHQIIWNGRYEDNLPAASGVYFYRLKSESFNSVRRMILMK